MIFIREVSRSTNKSLAFRTIGSCTPLCAKSTSSLKSSEVIDTLAYVVNFEDSMGFVIVPSDIRVGDDALAFAEIGTADIESDNPGFALFMSYANNYMQNRIEDFDNEYDSLRNELTDKFDTNNVGGGTNKKQEIQPPIPDAPKPWHTIKQVLPLTVVEWGQRYPYNKYTTTIDGEQTLTGCVAVATAQIMAKWQYPNIIGTTMLNWSEMVQYTDNLARSKYFNNQWTRSILSIDPKDTANINNIARLMREIGNRIGMKYGIDESGTKTENAANWLIQIGYRVDGECGYDIDRVKSSIDNGCIVLAHGSKEKVEQKFIGITYNTYYKRGHAWNIDGYISQAEQYDDVILDEETGRIIGQQRFTRYRDFIHINWGWYGSNNGFFLSGVFDYKKKELESDGNKSDNISEYKYNLGIFTNIQNLLPW